jgi:hypothetical protein
MSDERYASKLYKVFKGDSISPEEAKWNLMHTMHAVYCSSKKDENLRTTLLDLSVGLMDLKVL